MTDASLPRLDNPISRNEVAFIAAIVVVAVALRLAWALTVRTHLPPFSDPQWYFAVAKDLADGRGATITKGPFGTLPGPGGFETLRWPVGYPLSLAPAFKLFGATLTTAKVVNALAGAATVPFAFNATPCRSPRATCTTSLRPSGIVGPLPQVVTALVVKTASELVIVP